MKKNKNNEIILFVLIFVIILPLVLLSEIGDWDELWNYNFARNFSGGLVPYKDFNMVQTPLFAIICGTILKITVNELIVMRILAALLCSAIIYITYRLFDILKIKKQINMFFIFLIGIIFGQTFYINYNVITLFVVLLIIYNEIKNYYKTNCLMKSNLKRDVFLGILAGLTVMLKQNVGVFICIALLGNKILFIKSKNEFKIYIKSFIYRLIGVMIPIILVLIYLILNDALLEFINYTIKGIAEFSNYIPYNSLFTLDFIGLLSILVPVTFAYEVVKTIILKKDDILYIFLVYALGMFAVCFPISDNVHFIIGMLPTLIVIFYELYNFGKNKWSINTKERITSILKFCWPTIKIFLVCICIGGFYQYFESRAMYSNLEHFSFIPIDSKLEAEIQEVGAYLKANNDVKILDASAVMYMIPIDRYNKGYDLLLKGNLGFDGEENIIKQIKNSKDTKYLILKDEFNKNWQISLDIINCVKNNKTKIEEVGRFDVYK